MPLRPLKEVWPYVEDGDAFYIGERYLGGGYEGEEPYEVGWVVADQDYPFHLEDGAALPMYDEYDFDKTLARLLQPGERLVITYEGER